MIVLQLIAINLKTFFYRYWDSSIFMYLHFYAASISFRLILIHIYILYLQFIFYINNFYISLIFFHLMLILKVLCIFS